MNAFAASWQSLTTDQQAALAGVVAGGLVSLLQWIWTKLPFLPALQPDSSELRKRVVSVVLAVMGAVAAKAAGRLDPSALPSLILAAFAGGQLTFGAAKSLSGRCQANQPPVSQAAP